jgi:hypothetical protein
LNICHFCSYVLQQTPRQTPLCKIVEEPWCHKPWPYGEEEEDKILTTTKRCRERNWWEPIDRRVSFWSIREHEANDVITNLITRLTKTMLRPLLKTGTDLTPTLSGSLLRRRSLRRRSKDLLWITLFQLSVAGKASMDKWCPPNTLGTFSKCFTKPLFW